MADFSSDRVTIDPIIDTTAQDISQIQSDLSTAQSDISSAQSDISAAQLDIQSIQSSLPESFTNYSLSFDYTAPQVIDGIFSTNFSLYKIIIQWYGGAPGIGTFEIGMVKNGTEYTGSWHYENFLVVGGSTYYENASLSSRLRADSPSYGGYYFSELYFRNAAQTDPTQVFGTASRYETTNNSVTNYSISAAYRQAGPSGVNDFTGITLSTNNFGISGNLSIVPII